VQSRHRALADPPGWKATRRRRASLFGDPAQVKQMLANDIAFYMGWLRRGRLVMISSISGVVQVINSVLSKAVACSER
jgi:hypothetical protein